MVEKVPFNTPGRPAYDRDDGFAGIELLVGDIPPNGAPVDLPVGAGTDTAFLSVVGQVGNVATGALTLAKADGSIKAIGVLMTRAIAAAGVTTQTARVHTSGHFNANALVWDASFDTFAKKVAAFPVGTHNILIGRNPYDPVFTA